MGGLEGRIGPYRVLRRLGVGGMGEVFEAIHERLDRRVALKRLSAETASDPQLVARLVQEGRALGQLRHPGIVEIYECLEHEGAPYLAMELLEGVSLRAWMQDRGAPPPLADALAIGGQIADAMAAVHAQRIIHRDLKPENIFLLGDEEVPPGCRVKVLDFGIAKVPSARHGEPLDTEVKTAAPAVLGTTRYMAPEQSRNAAEVTERADVYALGAVMYELIAGRPPFTSSDDVELITQHLLEVPAALRSLVPEIPVRIGSFVAAMLAKAPEERPTMRRCREVFAGVKLGARADAQIDESDRCPFPGLQPFSAEHAELFFARETEIAEVLALVRGSGNDVDGEARRWIQIEGPSGAGKSSLVQAGVLASLREEAGGEGRASGAPRWTILNLRPTDELGPHLARALTARLPDAERERERAALTAALAESPPALAAWLRDHPPPGDVLLVLEQLEELFTLPEASRRRLDELLASALAVSRSPLRLLTTLRSDFLHRLDQLPYLAGYLNRAARYHLRTLNQTALERIIEGMAQRAGLQMATGLPQRIGKDAAETDSPLPLLGHVLRDLWSPGAGEALTLQRYEALGGVGGALAQHAERVLDELGQEGLLRARAIFLSLVQIGRDVPDTRRPRPRREALAAAGNDELAERVLLHLSGAPSRDARAVPAMRLLALSVDEPMAAGEPRVDLIHETLLRAVPRFAAWLREDRVLLERQADLEGAAHTWRQASSPSHGLPTGPLLAHYRGRDWPAAQQARLLRMTTEPARQFLAAAQGNERRRVWVRRGLLILGGLMTVAIALVAVSARSAQQRAEENLQLFIRATDGVVSDTDWELARYPHMRALRDKTLRNIEDSFLRLRARDPDVFEVQQALIKTWHRLSDLERESGSLRAADAALSAAEVAIASATARWPGGEGLRWQHPLNLSKRGKVALAQGRLEEARAAFAESVRLLEALVDGEGSEDAVRTLAIGYAEQADVELEAGRTREAGERYDRALALLERNAPDDEAGALDEDRAYNRSMRVQTLGQRARTARERGELAAAEALLARGFALQLPVVHASAGNAMYRAILASLHLERAALRAQQGRPEEALEDHRAVRAQGDELHAGDPTNKTYALLLCAGLVGEEAALRWQGDAVAAERVHRQRCDLAAALLAHDDSDARFQRFRCH